MPSHHLYACAHIDRPFLLTCRPYLVLCSFGAPPPLLLLCSAWYERQTKLDAEVKEEAKARKEKDAAERKAEEEAAPATPHPLPPTP